MTNTNPLTELFAAELDTDPDFRAKIVNDLVRQLEALWCEHDELKIGQYSSGHTQARMIGTDSYYWDAVIALWQHQNFQPECDEECIEIQVLIRDWEAGITPEGYSYSTAMQTLADYLDQLA